MRHVANKEDPGEMPHYKQTLQNQDSLMYYYNTIQNKIYFAIFRAFIVAVLECAIWQIMKTQMKCRIKSKPYKKQNNLYIAKT